MFALLLLLAQGTSALPIATYTDGSCVEYAGMCTPFVGSKVFIGSNDTLSDREELIYDALSSVRTNEGVLPAACVTAQDRFWCAQTYQQCKGPGEVSSTIGYSTPVLACKTPACKDLWEKCAESVGLYLSAYINNDPLRSRFINCGGALTFPAPNAQPEDHFYPASSRDIPNYPLRTPRGYAGQPFFPDAAATYTYPNGTTASVACYTITNADRATKITLTTNRTTAPSVAAPPTKSAAGNVVPDAFVAASSIVIGMMMLSA
jgi:hypothetical protein